ncbi:Alpha/Beta hydrolase protein [Favolaschia claudopus]|uniref:Alpha/Beta hydrolase protein n=1 Tax=Favolaschia claudopus TaxID=2862362 RepID=A0AAW0AZ30_9AGAR
MPMLAAPKSKQAADESILPHQAPFIAPQTPPSSIRTSRLLLGSVLTLALLCWNRSRTSNAWSATLQPFYAHVKTVENICPAVDGPGISHSGHIGLKGDSEDSPKRLFFWYFEAEQDAANAPIIMTIGGGPGTSGMMNPIMAQGPCLSAENGTTKPNPNRWTAHVLMQSQEHYNLLALDHPVGVGFSYGQMVNNSRDAAIDTYDFLQKFFRLYPHLSQNKFVLSGGSYGGTYVPHIATVIHEQNLALAAGTGARHINLESLMLNV